MPVGALAFWVGMGIAALRFPSAYDWRNRTVSQLLYPERNPAGHLWASGALVACAVGGLIGSIGMRGERCLARYVLGSGYGLMIASSLLPERWLSLPHGHDILAAAAFASVCCGLIGMWWRYFALTRAPSRPRDALLMVVVALPTLCSGLAYVSFAHLSFAWWEWLTCAVLSGCMAGIGGVYSRFETGTGQGQYRRAWQK
jgi:hypothetical protein